jgi:hypothetical protein
VGTIAEAGGIAHYALGDLNLDTRCRSSASTSVPRAEFRAGEVISVLSYGLICQKPSRIRQETVRGRNLRIGTVVCLAFRDLGPAEIQLRYPLRTVTRCRIAF